MKTNKFRQDERINGVTMHESFLDDIDGIWQLRHIEGDLNVLETRVKVVYMKYICTYMKV